MSVYRKWTVPDMDFGPEVELAACALRVSLAFGFHSGGARTSTEYFRG